MMRTNVDDSIGDSSRREDDILGLVAPQLLACAGIERIEQVVLRTNVDNPISDRGRGADSVPGRVTPYPGPRSVVKSIQVVVPGADVDDSFCYYWGGLNTSRCGVAPEGITSTSVQGIECVIQGADIHGCAGYHGRGLDGISCCIRPGSSQSRNLGGKDHSTRRSVLCHPNLLWIAGCQRFLSNSHMSYIYYILAGMGFLVTRLSHLHHIFALACYFPVNPLLCICSRSNSAGARGLTPAPAHAWPIKSKPSCSPCAISEGSFVLSISKQCCRCSIASSSF